MKKIIAILAALAVVSMAFAQEVKVRNELETCPVVRIDGNAHQWGFDNDESILRDTVVGELKTLDGRAEFAGRVRFYVQTRSTDGASILNVSPRWCFTTDATASALLKPIEGLEFRVIGNEDFLSKSFGPNLCYGNLPQSNIGNIQIYDITGGWQNPHQLKQGAYVAFTGVEGLWVGAGLNYGIGSGAADGETVWNKFAKGATPTNGSLIKKGAFGPLTVGATYDTDLFDVGAKYVGQFGGYNGTAGEPGVGDNYTGKFNHHNIYAGFTFKGLAEAKVGTTIGAAVDFDTYSASSVMSTKAYTGLAASVNAAMDFRNGIGDTVTVTVGYGQYDGKKAKVLPFYVGNDLSYSMDSAKFSLHTSYLQGAFVNPKKTYTKETTEADVMNGNYASVITLKPNFSFDMGQHSFEFGVETQVANQIKYNQKTSSEWAFTSLYGKEARVKFPVKWTYRF